MKLSFAAVFALLFVAGECFIVPENWLTKHGYTLKKPNYYGKTSRRFHGRKDHRYKHKTHDGYPLGPFTDDFTQWLEINGYAEYDFPALYLGINASYGGKDVDAEESYLTPVIFIHGNSDGALDAGTEFSSGFSSSIKYFLKKGYTSAVLYAVTWGDRNLTNSFSREHTCESMRRIRKFIEAVLFYTKAEKIDIIAHSMGVTMARKALKGGWGKDHVEECNLGYPVYNRVRTFLGIAGANLGLCLCDRENVLKLRVCDNRTGFAPGNHCKAKITDENMDPDADVACINALPENLCDPLTSDILEDLAGRNQDGLKKDGEKVFSFWSEEDEIVGKNNVWGHKTSLVPFSDEYKVFPNMKHHQLKTDTVEDQYKVIVEGTIF